MKTKELKIFNGRWKGRDHFFVCAFSIADAIRMMNDYVGRERITRYEANEYWSKDCWGRDMDGIQQTRGLWIQEGGQWGGRGVPKRVAP